MSADAHSRYLFPFKLLVIIEKSPTVYLSCLWISEAIVKLPNTQILGNFPESTFLSISQPQREKVLVRIALIIFDLVILK